MRNAKSDRQVVFLRDRYARPDVRPYPLPTAIRLDTGELVEARLEPFVEAVRDLHCFVDCAVGGQHAIHHTLGSLGGDVAVQLHHGDAFGRQFRRIDLYFIIALSLYAQAAHPRPITTALR